MRKIMQVLHEGFQCVGIFFVVTNQKNLIPEFYVTPKPWDFLFVALMLFFKLTYTPLPPPPP